MDLSTFRLDAATIIPESILPSGITVRNVVLGRPKHNRVDRIRRIPDAVERLTRVSLEQTIMKHTGGHYERPDVVVIEDPFGNSGNARKALDEVVGAIIASVGVYCPRAEVKLIKASEWRKALGAKNTKEAGHKVVFNHLTHIPPYDVRTAIEYDEHELDALGVALGYLQKEKNVG